MDARLYIPIVKKSGYEGIEFAPYTIFPDFNLQHAKKKAAEMHKLLQEEGLSFSGFHWLLAHPEGMHLFIADQNVRNKSWDHLMLLCELSYELGGGTLVLGSPRQRTIPDDVDRKSAIFRFIDELTNFIKSMEGSKSILLIEALSPDQTNFITTLKEASSLVQQIHSPYFQTMFDFHNAKDEVQPWDVLIDEYFNYIKHIHINEIDGNAPGTGTSDYQKAFSVIRKHLYEHWVSMELFSIPANPEKCIRDALQFQKKNFRLIHDKGGIAL